MVSAGVARPSGYGQSRRRDHERLRNTVGDLEIKVRQRTSDLVAVNRNLRDLSARLLELQDQERRRMAANCTTA